MDNKVFVWLANFQNRQEFEAYTETIYDVTERASMSKFCDDIGIKYYDDEFQEFSFHDKFINPKKALKGHSYAKSFEDSFIQSLEKLNFDKSINVVFLLYYHYDLRNYEGYTTENSPLIYMGKFEYDVESEFDFS